jgi:hypothetical protein
MFLKNHCMTTFFINRIYCCQMIKNIFDQSTFLMEKKFTASKIHNHQHYHNIM